MNVDWLFALTTHLIDAFRDVRVLADRALQLIVADQWSYDLGWGNYSRSVDLSGVSGGSVRLRLCR